MNPIYGFGETLLSPTHLLFLLVIGILIFGKRLPEIGRSLGKGLVEFKKGLKGLEDEVEGTVRQEPSYQPPAASIEPPRPPQRVATNVPKFEDAGNVTPPQPQV
jgi:sec-independent protein translocase protein TatA